MTGLAGRTLTGAWIETVADGFAADETRSRTLTGAWIETLRPSDSKQL